MSTTKVRASSTDSILKQKMELKRKYKDATEAALELASKKMQRKDIPSECGESKTICWNCAKAYGYCSWSAGFVPVEGWEALETAYEGIRYTTSFVVYKCPQYEKEVVRKSTFPKLREKDLPLVGDMQVKRVYCETDDVYFKTILDCAKYIEEKGDYNEEKNAYWVLTIRRSKGFKKITIGGRVYRFLSPNEESGGRV